MKALHEFENIYLCREFVDFRKSINGLSAIVEADLRYIIEPPGQVG